MGGMMSNGGVLGKAIRHASGIEGWRMMPVLTLVALLASASSSVLAQEGGEYRGTAAQQAACTSDVFRLCSSEIPSVERIVACLKRERPRLSDACHSVFSFNHRLGHRRHFASDHHGRRHSLEHHSERLE